MKNIKQLVFKLLNSPDPSIRRKAAEELSEADERAIYPLIKALRDQNTAVQEAATHSLISIGSRESYSLIDPGEVVTYMVIPLLREHETYLRNTAILIIKEIGYRVPELLYKLLKDKDPDIRKFALDLIADIKRGFDPSMILPLMKDENGNVRAAAAHALGELGYRESIPFLVENLNDEEWVVFYVLQSLAQLKAEEVADKIGELLLNTESLLIKAEAIETLGKIGTENVAEPLLKYFPLATKDEKQQIVKALIRIGIIPDGQDLKEEILSIFREQDWDAKLIALKGIKIKNIKEAIPLIVEEAGALDPSCFDYDEKIQLLEDALISIDSEDELILMIEKNKLRFRAKAFVIKILGTLKSQKAVPILINLLEDIKRDIRIASARALGEIGSKEVVSPLIKKSGDDYDPNVRKAAIEALGMIRAPEAYEALSKLLEKESYFDIIEALVTSLISIDPDRFLKNLKSYRREVKQVLANITYSFEILDSLLKCEDKEVQKAALYALGRLANEQAISKILEFIKSEDKELKKIAILALGEANFCSTELIQCVKDEDPWIRYYAIKSIYKACDPDVVFEKIAPLLDDPFPPVVIAALEALSELGGPEVYDILISKKNHPDKEIREKIEEVLQKL
ncbi:MAG: HEAT repeat domain-containing protein [Thermodesulfovibrio sp.]|nr:HEAT repeat domain-containing protein [Thermodesulfovibrio sp.]MDW7999245.1 HEAT repeat domain-containing protein [Thermodesulfovibrio sp.]